MTHDKSKSDADRAAAISSASHGTTSGKRGSDATPATKPTTASAGFDTSKYQGARDTANQSTVDTAKKLASDAANTVTSSIETAREVAGETLESARERVSDGYDTAVEWAGENYERGARAARSVAHQGRRGVSQASERTVDFFEDYPLMLGAVGFAGGLILGAMLPRTRSEDKYLGHWRDELESEGLRYGRESVAQARRFATDKLRDARSRAEQEVLRATTPPANDIEPLASDTTQGNVNTQSRPG